MAPPFPQSSATSQTIAGAMQPGSARDPRLRSLGDSQTSLSSLPPERLQTEVVHWADRAMRQAEEESSQSLSTKLIPRIIQYLSGNQWPSRPTAYGSSRPVTNRMFRQYWELVSLLTDGKPEPEIKVWDKQDTYSEIQAFLEKSLAYWSASSLTYRPALQDIIGFGLLARGIGKVQWNPRANRGMGDVEILSVNPLNFYTLGGDGSVPQAECCIETKRVTLASLRRRFGHLADGIEPDTTSPMMNSQVMRPSQLTSAEWSKLSPQMQRVLGVKSSANVSDALYPMCTQRLFWMLDPSINETSRTVVVGPAISGKPGANWAYYVEPGELLYPRGRVLTIAGRRVLNDSPNPYFFATHPYVEMTPLRAPWSAEGMSLLGNLIGPQDIINRIMAGLLETIKAGLIPTIITPRNAVSRSDLDNMSTTISGGKLEYNPVSPAPPSFRPQPSVPQLALPFLQIVTTEMDQTTGSAAVDAAAQKEQIPSHDTMEMIQNSRSGMVRLMGRQLEQFMSDAGQKVVSTMLQFYTVAHRVGILGERGILSTDFQPMYGSLLSGSMMPEEFVRKFQFSIKPGSALSFSQETKAEMALLLRRQGDLSRNNLFRALDANFDLKQNEAELATEALQKLAVAGMASQAAGKNKG